MQIQSSKNKLSDFGGLLSAEQMRKAERAAIKRGLSGWRLMNNAASEATKIIVDTVYNSKGKQTLKSDIYIDSHKNQQSKTLSKPAKQKWQPQSMEPRCYKALVVCGSGNNGGDGYLIASKLQRLGWQINVLSLLNDPWHHIDKDHLGKIPPKDSVLAALRWVNESKKAQTKVIKQSSEITSELFENYDVVVDAIIGIGLNRELSDEILCCVNEINLAHEKGAKTFAVDVPTGVNTDNGNLQPSAVNADITITFGALKLCHALMPAADLCGKVVVSDIGLIEQDMVDQKNSYALNNNEKIWKKFTNNNRRTDHKYNWGNVLIASGGDSPMLGASKLATLAAMKSGCGLVSTAVVDHLKQYYLTKSLGEMVRIYVDDDGYIKERGDFSGYKSTWGELISDTKFNAVLVGPGGGDGEIVQKRVKQAIMFSPNGLVLDASALTCWEDEPLKFYELLNQRSRKNPNNEIILTPHSGEFNRIFPHSCFNEEFQRADKPTKALIAARKTGAIIVLKGADTVIAAPDGKVAIQRDAPAGLAVAGSGDVLAGIIAGLRANHFSAFSSACAGVYYHAESAKVLPKRFMVNELVSNIHISCYDINKQQ